MTLACEHRDDLGAEAFEFVLDAVQAAREDVVAEYRRNRRGERHRGCDQRLGDARSNGGDVAGTLCRDANERIDDAEYRSEKAEERARRTDHGERRDPASQLVALHSSLRVQHELQRFHLGPAKRHEARGVGHSAGVHLPEEFHRAVEHSRERTWRGRLGETAGIFQPWGVLHGADELLRGIADATELPPLEEHDRPAEERQHREDDENELRDRARVRHQLPRRGGDCPADLQKRERSHDGCLTTPARSAKKRNVSSRPCSSDIRGDQPSTVRAFALSTAERCSSPSRAGARSTGTDAAAAALSTSSSVTTGVSTPVPMLYAREALRATGGSFTVAARRFARATSETYT